MINNWKGLEEGDCGLILSSNVPEGTEEIPESFSQNSRCCGRDSNTATLDYKTKVLPLHERDVASRIKRSDI
jgi:hypothetical protein